MYSISARGKWIGNIKLEMGRMGVSVISLVKLGASRSSRHRGRTTPRPRTLHGLSHIARSNRRDSKILLVGEKHVCVCPRGVTTCRAEMDAHVVSRVRRLLCPGPRPRPRPRSMLEIVSSAEIFEGIGVAGGGGVEGIG